MSYRADLSLFDFVGIRESFGEREKTLLAYPASFLAPFGLLALSLSIMFYEDLPPRYSSSGFFIGAASMIVGCIMMAGRGDIFNFLIIVFWWLLQRPILGKKMLPGGIIFKSSILFLISLSLLAVVFIAVIRSDVKDEKVSALLQFHTNSLKMDDDIQDFLMDINPVSANTIGEVMIYWSHSVIYFDKVYSDWELSPTIVTAFSPFIERRLEALDLIPSGAERWQHWTNITTSYGLYPNAFGAAWYQLIVSLGRIGGLAAAILIAFFSGKMYVKARIEADFRCLLISSLFFIFFILWFQASAFIYGVFEYTMVIALLGVTFLKKLVRVTFSYPQIQYDS